MKYSPYIWLDTLVLALLCIGQFAIGSDFLIKHLIISGLVFSLSYYTYYILKVRWLKKSNSEK